MMKDLLLRVAVSAIVGTVVSAGILYFAFDQALRGIETAVQGNTAAVSETGAWIRSLDQKIGDLTTSVDVQTQQMDKRFDDLALGIVEGRARFQASYAVLLQNTQGLRTSLESTILTTAQIATVWKETVPATDPRYGELAGKVDILLSQFEAQQIALEKISESLSGIVLDF